MGVSTANSRQMAYEMAEIANSLHRPSLIAAYSVTPGQ